MFDSDDQDVKNAVHHSDKKELEMICVADESKIRLRRAY